MVIELPLRLPDLLAADSQLAFGQWLVEDGDPVHEGERLAEVLTQGVLVYVTAPRDGTLRQRPLMPGAPLTVASTLGEILADDEESAGE